MPPPTPLRVGLLLCDDVDDAAQSRYGTYADMFRRGMGAADDAMQLTRIPCHLGQLPDSPQAFDAYLISGSRRGVYEPLPWIAQLQDFVRHCHGDGQKTVGICFGHQLIAHALGGETRKAEAGWGLGIHATTVHAPQAWMTPDPAPSDYRLVVIHQDQVVTVPPGFEVIAGDPFCPHGMIADDIMLGIQGHPEFDAAFCEYRIRARQSILPSDVYDRALASLGRARADSGAVFRWIVRFLRH